MAAQVNDNSEDALKKALGIIYEGNVIAHQICIAAPKMTQEERSGFINRIHNWNESLDYFNSTNSGPNFLSSDVGRNSIDGYKGFFETFQSGITLQGENFKMYGMNVLHLINQEMSFWQEQQLGLSP